MRETGREWEREKERGGEREGEGQRHGSCIDFHDLILEVAYHYFCHILLLVTQNSNVI